MVAQKTLNLLIRVRIPVGEEQRKQKPPRGAIRVTLILLQNITKFKFLNKGYIYCQKYVGKTTYSITKRFQEHCKDSKKERCERRPLYDAMNKYGIEKLIECPNDELDSYEKMYIEITNLRTQWL